MAVVLLLLVTPIIGFCNCSIFCYICPFLFCDHHEGEKREMDALLSLSSWCLMLSLSAMGLSAVCDCDISQSYSLTIFGCHSCEQRWLWRACTFAWSSLSLRLSSIFLCGGSNGDSMPICASSEGSGESAHLHRLTLAIVTVQNLLCCLKWRFVCYSRQQRILW